MGGFLIAWLVGLGLSVAQGVHEWKVSTGSSQAFPLTYASPLPVKPGQILIASGIYVALAIIAESQSMHNIAVLTAWAYNTAIALKWAQNYSTEKSNKIAANGSAYWSPPAASSTSLFPSGTTATTPASQPTGPGTTSGGPVAA